MEFLKYFASTTFPEIVFNLASNFLIFIVPEVTAMNTVLIEIPVELSNFKLSTVFLLFII